MCINRWVGVRVFVGGIGRNVSLCVHVTVCVCYSPQAIASDSH